MIKLESGGRLFHIDERFEGLNNRIIYRIRNDFENSYVGYSASSRGRIKAHLYNLGARQRDLSSIFGNAKIVTVKPTKKFNYIKSKDIKEWYIDIMDIDYGEKDFPSKEGLRLYEEVMLGKKVINSVVPPGFIRIPYTSISQYDEKIGFYDNSR